MTRTKRGTFASGNPGKPKGARSATTRALEVLMDDEAREITRRCIEEAKKGDMIALRICMDRIFPARKGRPVPFSLPEVQGLADVPKAGAAILTAVAAGELSPEEAGALMGVVTQFRQSVEANEILDRIAALEASREN